VFYLAGPLREECTPSVVGISEVTAKSILQNSIKADQPPSQLVVDSNHFFRYLSSAAAAASQLLDS